MAAGVGGGLAGATGGVDSATFCSAGISTYAGTAALAGLLRAGDRPFASAAGEADRVAGGTAETSTCRSGIDFG